MKNKVDYSLYLCTDRKLMSSKTIEESVELALMGGCTIVQLREKDCSSKEFYELALRVKEITKKYNVPLIINDRVDIALAADADGVHLGQSDLPAEKARKILGNDKIIGVSASTLALAKAAQADGADYIGVGAVFNTSTKLNTNKVTLTQLKEICSAADIPVVAIGGINKQNLHLLKGSGISGAAAVSAIVSQKDVTAAAKELLNIIKNYGLSESST